MKNARHQKVMSSNCLICLNNSPKAKDSSFTIMNDKKSSFSSRKYLTFLHSKWLKNYSTDKIVSNNCNNWLQLSQTDKLMLTLSSCSDWLAAEVTEYCRQGLNFSLTKSYSILHTTTLMFNHLQYHIWLWKSQSVSESVYCRLYLYN